MLFAIVALVGVGVFAYAQLKLKAHSEKIASLEAAAPKEPINVLILGSDSRAVLSGDDLKKFDPSGHDRSTGRRADTIILVQLDAKREKAVVLSFPRDLRVTYPNGAVGKINGAYQQGPDFMVKTVEKYTGLPVNHFVEVNFVGFRNIVDALGGVQIYFERPIKDRDSGLNVPKGCQLLKGDQALSFVRVRKIDDDFGRITRQQLFARILMNKVVSGGTILNPFKVFRLVNLFAENVTTDRGMSLSQMKTLGLRLRHFDSAHVDMRVIPVSRVGLLIKGQSYVIANDRQTQALLRALKDHKPLPDYGRTGVSPIEPSDVVAAVLNGAGEGGIAGKEADVLKAKGFQITGQPTNADRSDYAKTVVYYVEGNQDRAQLLASVFGADVKLLPKSISVPPDAEVVLVLGKDFVAGKATPPPPAPATGGKSKPPPPPLVHAC
jgi:LCP family protein required for cell wall assembly